MIFLFDILLVIFFFSLMFEYLRVIIPTHKASKHNKIMNSILNLSILGVDNNY